MKKYFYYILASIILVLTGSWYFWHMSARDKVSLLIPAYNVENYIDECIQSILKQTYKNLEVIIVDDASTDHTFSKLEQYAAKDQRIKLFRHDKNQGAAAAREMAFSKATGKYVMFIDSDDYISSGYVRQMVRAIHRYKTPFVLNNSVSLQSDTSGKKIFLWWTLFPASGKTQVSKQCMWFQWALWGKIFDRDFLEQVQLHFPHIRHHTDSFSHALFLAHTDQIAVFYSSNAEYVHRVRENSLQTETVNTDERLRNHFSVMQAVWEYLKTHNLLNSARPNIGLLEQEILMIAKNPEPLYMEIRQFLQSAQPDIEANASLYLPDELDFMHNVLTYPDYKTYTQNVKKEPIGYWPWYQKNCFPNIFPMYQ